MHQTDRDFFDLEDEEAIAATERLRSHQGSGDPAYAVDPADARRVSLDHGCFRDAVLAATLKSEPSEIDSLLFGFGNSSIQLHARYQDVETRVSTRSRWVEATKPLCFNLPQTIAGRISSLKRVKTIEAQVRLDRHSDSGELRVKLGSARLRLGVRNATIAPCASHMLDTVLRPDPRALSQALNAACKFLRVIGENRGTVAVDGAVYAGSKEGIVAFKHASFVGLTLSISAKNASILARVLRRMKDPTFSATATHYVFRDELIYCRVARLQVDKVDCAQYFDLTADFTFSPSPLDLNRANVLAEIVKPDAITVGWPAISGPSEASIPITVAATSRIGHRMNDEIQCRILTPTTCAAQQFVFAAKTWLTAVRLFDLDAPLDFDSLGGGNVLKLTGRQGEIQVSVMLAATST